MIRAFEFCGKFCPATIGVNLGAIVISMSDLEIIFKLASYGVAIVWTAVKVVKEIKNWNEKKIAE